MTPSWKPPQPSAGPFLHSQLLSGAPVILCARRN